MSTQAKGIEIAEQPKRKLVVDEPRVTRRSVDKVSPSALAGTNLQKTYGKRRVVDE